MNAAHPNPTTRGVYVPLVIALSYLVGTYLIFLVLPMQSLVVGPGVLARINYLQLSAFVLVSYGCFAAGYLCGVARHLPLLAAPRELSPDRVARMRLLIVLGAVYYFVYGATYITMYAGGLGSVLNAGEAYRQKLERMAQLEQELGDNASPLVQLLTLTYLASYVLVPLTVLLWGRMTSVFRGLAVASIAAYVLGYLAVGTQKGLGDLVIYTGAAQMVCFYGAWQSRRADRSRRPRLVAAAVVAIMFISYMGFGQVSRMETYGARASGTYSMRGTWLADALGENVAFAVANVLGYPSHGYAGLGLDLELPFEWTYGLGNSRALTSYANRYLGIDVAGHTYLARNETLTGWPAGMYWSTVFPWLASDVTFLGCFPVMFSVGWLWGKCWIESLACGSTSSVILFTQLCLFVAYVPGNNQLVQNQFSLLGTVALGSWWLYDHGINVRTWFPRTR